MKNKAFFSICVLFTVMFLFACTESGSITSGGGGSSSGSGNGGENGNPGQTGTYAALPNNKNAGAIQAMYDTWINTYYTTYEQDFAAGVFTVADERAPGTARIKAAYSGSNDGSKTCSEAIGYGMILTALMGDWEKFNKLLAYSKLWHYSIGGNKTSLMRWSVISFVGAENMGSATDADIDILAALIVAYRKTGTQSYLNDALAIGASIYEYEIDASSRLVLPATNAELLGNGTIFNISYMSLPALKMLVDYDKNRDWATVLESNLSYMESVQNNGDGLWPDWSGANGTPVNPNNGSSDALAGGIRSHEAYYKEGPRIPWRIAWYYHWYGDPRAKAMLDKGMAFLRGKGVSTYQDVKTFYSYTGGLQGATATSPMAWASLCALGTGNSANQDWLNSCNERMTGFYNFALSNYYASSLQLIYAMLFNGRFD